MRFEYLEGMRPGERLWLAIDMAGSLAFIGDEVLSNVVSVYDESDPGTDLTATLIEAPAIDGSLVNVILKGPVAHGHTYRVQFAVGTVMAQTIKPYILVRVSDDA